MPAKNKSKLTTRQKNKIAVGKVIGKRNADIAREAGCSVSTVAHKAGTPELQTLIQRLKKQDEPQLKRIWKKALKKIEADLDKAADIRIPQIRNALRVITAGDPSIARIDPPDGSKGDFTLEELLITYRRVATDGP